MNTGKTLFAQLMDFLPWTTFTRLVNRYGGDRYVKSLTCAEQFRVMAFAQLTYRESLRDIEVCLAAQSGQALPHGIPAGDQAIHAGRCQRAAGLADLRRVCAASDCAGSNALPRREPWGRTGEHRLRPGLDD